MQMITIVVQTRIRSKQLMQCSWCGWSGLKLSMSQVHARYVVLCLLILLLKPKYLTFIYRLF